MKHNNFYFLLLLACIGATAQNPGTLNPEFSGNGWDTIYGHNNGFEVHKMLIQPDGKLLITAEANFSNEGHQAVLARYNPNGTLDETFGGGDGVIRTVQDHPDGWDGEYLYTRASGMALQNNGKIIVAGDQFYNTERILRFNTDGSLDTTFGTDGIVDRFPLDGEFIYHVAVQSNDKIIVCGTSWININDVLVRHIFLWRLMPDGAIDNSFGNSGVVSYNHPTWLNGDELYLRVNDLIVLPNDELLVNHSFISPSGSVVWLRKMTANGSPDLSFANAGNSEQLHPTNFGEYTYSNSAWQQDGSIISTYTVRSDADLGYNESLFKVNAQGIIDPNFNISLSTANTFAPDLTKVTVHENLFYVWEKLYDETLSNPVDVMKCFDHNGNLIDSFGIAGTAIITQNDIPISYGGAMAIADNGGIFVSSVSDSASGNPVLLTYNLFGADASLGVNKNLDARQIAVYPNPSSGIINVAIPNVTVNSLSVIDVLGKTVLNATDCSQIDVSILSDGLYTLKIQSGEQNYVHKIIKN